MKNINKHDDLVKVAKTCFENFGYKATTIEQITKMANMGKGTFYNFFNTKEELFQFIIEEGVEKIISLAEATMNKEPLTIQVLYNYLSTVLSYKENYLLFRKLSLEADAFGTIEVVEGLKYMKNAVFTQLKRILQLFVDRNIIEAGNIELTAFLLLEIYNSLVYKWSENHPSLNYDEISSIYTQLFKTNLINI